MSTPMLFDIPKDKRGVSHERLMTAFCKEHGIWTHRTKGHEDPWIAMAWKVIADGFGEKCDGSDGECIDLFAGYCSWASDRGLLVEGNGRLSVLRKIAENLDLPDPLAGKEGQPPR